MGNFLNKNDIAMFISSLIVMVYLSVMLITTIKIHTVGLDVTSEGGNFISSIHTNLKELALIAVGFILKDKLKDSVQ